jgi:hypothetical protein
MGFVEGEEKSLPRPLYATLVLAACYPEAAFVYVAPWTRLL